MKKSIFTLAIICTLFLVTACGSSNPLVGTWKYETSSNYIYTFNDDKTCSYEAYGNKRECTYEDDGTKVTILYNGDTASSTYEYTIEGNTLTIKDSFGNDVKYVK